MSFMYSLCLHVFVCMYACINVCLYICVYVYMYVCIYIFITNDRYSIVIYLWKGEYLPLPSQCIDFVEEDYGRGRRSGSPEQTLNSFLALTKPLAKKLRTSN